MQPRALRCLMAAALVALAAPAGAEPAADPCRPAGLEHAPLTDRAAALAQFERLPQHCLRSMVRRCTAVAGESLLDPGSAAACSFSYEALLKKGFGGDFKAMLAWWRSEQVAKAD